MNGAQLLFKTLESRDVKTIFGIVGREAETLFFKESKKIEFVLTRDERNAAIMADMHGRLTNKIGVCFSTFGPGASNLLTGIASAYMDRSPVLAISAQVEKDTIHPSTHQCLNQVEFMRPVTKYAKEVYKIDDLEKEIIKAIEIAEGGLPGPCFISIPLDIFKEEQNKTPRKNSGNNPASYGREKDKRTEIHEGVSNNLEKLAVLLSKSALPIFIVGNGVYRDCDVNYFNKVINSFKAPFLATYSANGLIPSSNENYLGTVSKYLNNFIPGLLDEIFRSADLIVLMGVDMVEGITSQIWDTGREKNVCIINSNLSFKIIPLEKRLDIDASYRNVLRVIRKTLKNRDTEMRNVTNLKKRIMSMKNKLIKRRSTREVNPFKIADILNNILGKDDILISDVGLHKQIISLFYNARKPKTFFCSNGLGAMGFALPAAIAAKKTFPGRRIIAVCGDGGFYFSSNELETSIRYKLPVICLIFSDGSFGLIRHYQKRGFNAFNEKVTDFGKVDFVGLAKANGCKGFKVRNTFELYSFLSRNLNTDKTVLIEIPLSRKKYIW